ncbi:MAG: 3-methyl-2-oxobutanoate hydroxymethyltransferase [Acidobacteriota bacterium]|nr:3-methyl-2-oxobutanoate hydroxymethyltransferase [Acidobacteriota bacterium]MDQ7088209.1 3-methyl-2-oxobutanoate hydroxymethyltransferase [Acidobacteriota bacterium]
MVYGPQDGASPRAAAPRKITVPGIMASKGVRPLVMLTAYDAPSARIADEAGVDLLLVGDSLAMVVLGYEDTLRVDLEDMVRHTAAVARTRPQALVVADMPYLSYHTGPADAVRAAGRLVREGHAEAVKLEGGRRRREVIEALVGAEIPVMGHLGLTPQSLNAMGGYRVQGRALEQVDALLEDARILEEAGVFALVLEGVPAEVARRVTAQVGVPTIGIGAGADCDGQVLVFHDLLGLGDGPLPKFVKAYADLRRQAVSAVSAFADQVRSGAFPTPRHAYRLPRETAEALAARDKGRQDSRRLG